MSIGRILVALLLALAVVASAGPVYRVVELPEIADLDPNTGAGSIWNGQVAGGQGDFRRTGARARLGPSFTSSPRNLTPAGFGFAFINASAGGQQVGVAWENESAPNHAYLWSGSASSAVDLHPKNFLGSAALTTDGVHQAGYADSHAVV